MKSTHPRVFICHSSDDKPRFVRQLANDLADQGAEVWFDEWSLRTGDSLRQRIFHEGIAQCTHFLVVLTSRSINQAWVNEELDAATIARIEGGCELLPIVYGKLPHDRIPLDLRSKVYLRFPSARGSRYEQPLRRLMEDIGSTEVVQVLHMGPEVRVPMSGLTAFAAIRQQEDERWKEPLLRTTIEVALAGLTLTWQDGRLESRIPDPSTEPEEPIFTNWWSEGEGVRRSILQISGDPFRGDPFRIARRDVVNFGRGPMERTRGSVDLTDIGAVSAGNQFQIGLHLGAAQIEEIVGDPASVVLTGLFPQDMSADPTDLRTLVGQLCDSALQQLRSRDVCWQLRYLNRWQHPYDYAIVWNAKDQALEFLQFETGRWTPAGSFQMGLRRRTFR